MNQDSVDRLCSDTAAWVSLDTGTFAVCESPSTGAVTIYANSSPPGSRPHYDQPVADLAGEKDPETFAELRQIVIKHIPAGYRPGVGIRR